MTADLVDGASIVGTCTEATEDGSFPVTCSHSCAQVLVPYDDLCGELLAVVGDGVVGFSVSGYTEFSTACRQTLVLYERAESAGSCTAGAAVGLQSRVDAVNTGCCEQNGTNVCANGEPQTCDAECAAEFLPYWEECLDERAVIGGEMHGFTVLYTACTDHLPVSESLKLYQDIISLDDSPECSVDTSMVISRRQAKLNAVQPACDHDAFGICQGMIAAGVKSCEHDYCSTCPEAHSCDAECELPCAGGESIGGRRLQGEVVYGNEFGGFTSTIAGLTGLCPLETLGERLSHLDEICCSGDVCTENGMPAECPYDCGRYWTSFFEECEDVLSRFVDSVGPYRAFSSACLDVDPVSMTMILHTAVCSLCGDGRLDADEECDEGGANSNAPGASCRTNCHRPRCGDTVVDATLGEECDHGSLNSNGEGSACSLSCMVGGTTESGEPLVRFMKNT